MTSQKSFWGAQMALLLAVYAIAALKLLSGDSQHLIVLIASILLVAHTLEIPLAFHLLKGRSPSGARVILMTLLFGLVWWIPARRGIFKVN